MSTWPGWICSVTALCDKGASATLVDVGLKTCCSCLTSYNVKQCEIHFVVNFWMKDYVKMVDNFIILK